MAPVWYVDSRGESTMAKSERQKLKLLILRDYLRSHTDEQHPVSMQQILAALEGEGIRAERKSVYDDLATLRDYGMEIRKVSGKNGGYYVPERDFALSELKLLVDAVQAARFLSEKESMALIRKLAALSSAHEAELLRREVVVTGRAKSGSEDVCRNVDTLHAAIAGNSRITFRYFDWDLQGRRSFRPKTYEASPIALCWEDENYYLVAYGVPHGLTHYRVDKMTEITATGVPRESNDETRSFDPAVYSQQVFGMFRGEQCRMKLRFENSLAGVVLDRFGRDRLLVPDGPDHFVFQADISVSPTFLGWLAGFGGRAEIVFPASAAEAYRDFLRRALSAAE